MAKYPPQEENTIHTRFNEESALMAIREWSPARLRMHAISVWSYSSGGGTPDTPWIYIETPEKYCFEHVKRVEHIQDEDIADMFEWNETLAFNEQARMIGRIGSTRQEELEVQLAALPKLYWQHKELFDNENAEMPAPRRTLDHVIDWKDGATPPCWPIYPMSS